MNYCHHQSTSGRKQHYPEARFAFSPHDWYVNSLEISSTFVLGMQVGRTSLVHSFLLQFTFFDQYIHSSFLSCCEEVH